MALYLLDTNILIDLTGPRASARFFEQLLQDTGDTVRLGTSILCLAEFFAGASARETRTIHEWSADGELEILYLDAIEDAVRAGTLRKTHRLALPDALILATAQRHRAHLLTHDDVLLNTARPLIDASDPLVSKSA